MGGIFHSLKGYVITPNGNVLCELIQCVLVNGEFYGEIFDNSIILSEYNDALGYYIPDGGWYTSREIVITEATSPKVAAWLKANATKLEDVVGTWKFNETLTVAPIDTHFKFNSCWLSWDSMYNYYGKDGMFLVYRVDNNNYEEYEAYEDGWDDEECRTISIIEQPIDIGFIAWLKENAQFISFEVSGGTINKNGYLFRTSNGVNSLVGYEGDDTELVLPNGYDGESYVINDYAFKGRTSLTSVEIGDSVTSIGEGAFYKCTSLASVTVGNSVTSIGNYAFRNCSSLTSITIPDSVTSIGERAFYDCSSLENITFEGTTTEWNAITKGSNWNLNVPVTHVQCSDGQVAL